MLKTQNYGFNKPELSDSPPDITVMNSNWDTIDKKIKENTDAIAQNREIIGTVKTEITKMDMSWDKISGKPNSFVPSAHSHTKSDIGLGSVQNYGVATQAQVDEGKANNLYVTPLSLAGLKQSVVNGKQTVVNAINDSLGYNSGLTTNNSHDDYAWWIKNKIKKVDNRLLERILPIVATCMAASGLWHHVLKLPSKRMWIDASKGDYCDTVTLPQVGTYILLGAKGGTIQKLSNEIKYSVGDFVTVGKEIKYNSMSGRSYYGTAIKVTVSGECNIYANNYSGIYDENIFIVTKETLNWLSGEIN